MPEVVVVINRMPVLEVQVKWLGVGEVGSVGLATLIPGTSVHIVVGREQPTGSAHDLHRVVWLFHAPYVVVHAIERALHSSSFTDILGGHVSVDRVSGDETGPITALLDKRTGEDPKSAQSNQSLQHTESRIKHNITSSVVDGFRQSEEQSCSGAEAGEFGRREFGWMIFSFDDLEVEQNPRQTTADGVVFISKWMGLPRTEDPAGARPS